MLTQEDIKNLITAEREVFATKEDIGDVKERLSALTTSVDLYSSKADNYHKEMSVLIHRVDRVEEWIRQVADKVGITYKQ